MDGVHAAHDHPLVALVTGATRGIGKGIAVALGGAGASVYVTGRTIERGASTWSGSLAETAAAIDAAGGKGIPIACDHRDDTQVAAVFERIESEQGRLDLLVNNASAFGDTADGYPLDDVPFWEHPVALWDAMHTVGLRSHFVASTLAAPGMIARRSGLIVNISSPGASVFVFNAAYGAVKAGLDKLSADMAHDLQPYGVSVISLWPPFSRTEKYEAQLSPAELAQARRPEFTGKVVAALASDPHLREKSGRALRVVELAKEYGIEE